MTHDLDQLALDTALKIEDAFVRPYHSVNQRRAAIQILVREALDTALLPPQTIDMGGWVEWHGGKCPVPFDTLVDARISARDGSLAQATAKAQWWQWEMDKTAFSRIIAYRINKGTETK